MAMLSGTLNLAKLAAVDGGKKTNGRPSCCGGCYTDWMVIEIMIGKYQLKEDGVFVCGVTSFGLAAGATVDVRQYDKESRKVLIDFGDRQIDWFSDRILERFEAV